jgi:hypothetical protein
MGQKQGQGAADVLVLIRRNAAQPWQVSAIARGHEEAREHVELTGGKIETLLVPLAQAAAAPALFQAIDELLAEIDAGHVGRLTKREGMKAHEESFGTSLARAALALARAPSARGEA